MYNRYIMTLDPDRFPLERMRDIVDYLHEHDQHYVVMVDPAVAYQEQKYDNLTYETFTKGRDEGVFLYKEGEIFKGVVWPGVTSFPFVFIRVHHVRHSLTSFTGTGSTLTPKTTGTASLFRSSTQRPESTLTPCGLT